MRSLFSLLSLMLIFACSGKAPSKAKFKLEMTGLTLAATSLGGVVLFGTSGAKKFSRVVTTDSTEVELPPGSWSIGAIAWEGPLPMKGSVICALTSAQIAGETATVNLNLDTPTCFTSAFSTESGPTTAAAIDPQFCEDDVSSFSGPCNYNPTGPDPQRRGIVGSYRFSILSGQNYEGGTVPNTSLETLCYQTDTDKTSDTLNDVADLNIPAFVSGLGLPLNADAYLGENCEPGRGMLRVSFDNPGNARFGGSKVTYVRTPMALVCLESRKYSVSGFASGQGDMTFPYVICDYSQLAYLQQNYDSDLADNHYILGDDMNLLSGIQRGDGNAFDPDLEFGDTFVPIGLYFDVNGDIQSHSPPFSGGFDGNEKSIHHFRFHNNNSATNTGFISTMSGTGNHVSKIRFVRPKIEGSNYTGVAVGNSTSSLMQFFDVIIIEGDVRGGDYTGSIAGASTGTFSYIERSHSRKTEVEGKGRTGGLIGKIGDGNIQRSTFDGSIYAENGSMRVGGIAGESFAAFTETFSSGYLRASAFKMGGVVGEINGRNLETTGSSMLIKDLGSPSGSSRNIGGLIGSAVGTVNTGRNLFRGHIEVPCTSAGDCDFGGISGTSISSNVFNFSTAVYADGTGEDGDAPFDLTTALTISAYNHVCNAFPGCPWEQEPGDYPRLSLQESHPCNDPVNVLAPAVQAAGPHNRGTSEANPIIICNSDQLAINVMPKYFKVLDDLNLSQKTTDAGALSGHIDFNHKKIHSYKITDSNASSFLFSQIMSSASLKNADLINFNITETNTCTSCNKSALTNINSGLVSNVELRDSEISVSSSSTDAFLAGLVVTNNASGKITGSRVRHTKLNGFRMGGVSDPMPAQLNNHFQKLSSQASDLRLAML